jgi:tRNA-2-methylthio-N6-dimethylallyladenosine synthase
VEILVEGPSKSSRKRADASEVTQLVGRTVCDRIVVFPGPRTLIGRIIPVEIVGTDAFTLFGKAEGGGE